jgi:hypothetical protein
MRPWVILTSLALALASAGCGVFYAPVMQTFPEPVRAVRIVDDRTGKTIPDAQVACEVHRHNGWSHEQPVLREAAQPATSQPASQPQTAAPVTELKVVRHADGAFIVEKDSRYAWVQSYYPMHSAEGGRYYRDYAVRFRATAPEHDGLTLDYAVERPPVAGWSETAGGGKVEFDVNGVLWFHLKLRSAAAGD